MILGRNFYFEVLGTRPRAFIYTRQVLYHGAIPLGQEIVFEFL
jgi:hypothetical protein